MLPRKRAIRHTSPAQMPQANVSFFSAWLNMSAVAWIVANMIVNRHLGCFQYRS